ncbi:hypothetical protein DFH09DRAFT_1075405 [Mycena vulgaris]|nr:hypothetical protein DFH09DRAFT_1075405 [Mycena vulgaris]
MCRNGLQECHGKQTHGDPASIEAFTDRYNATARERTHESSDIEEGFNLEPKRTVYGITHAKNEGSINDRTEEAVDGNNKAPIAEGSSEAFARDTDFSELEDPASFFGEITDSGGSSDPASEKAQGGSKADLLITCRLFGLVCDLVGLHQACTPFGGTCGLVWPCTSSQVMCQKSDVYWSFGEEVTLPALFKVGGGVFLQACSNRVLEVVQMVLGSVGSGNEAWLKSDRDRDFWVASMNHFTSPTHLFSLCLHANATRSLPYPSIVIREGTKKSIFAKVTDICKKMHGQPEHVIQFLFSEMGSGDGAGQLVMKARFQQPFAVVH